MSNLKVIENFTPPAAMVSVAQTIVAAEGTALAHTAALGRLLSAAAEANIASGYSVPRTQPIFEDLERATQAQFDGLKHLAAVHRQVSAIGEQAVTSGFPWGPDEPCMILKIVEMARRAVA